ncbi:MAG: SIMPL domain-containing protein [Chitinispirillaceae bacterium]|jgi:hypothetical protein
MKNVSSTFLACISLIIISLILAHAIVNRNKANSTITVTGLGKEDFASDLIVWSGTFSSRNADLKTAAAQLNRDRETIRHYLQSKGVAEKQVVFSSVLIEKEFTESRDKEGTSTQKFTDYHLSQEIQIESEEVDKIDQVSREITELIDTGIELRSEKPQYYYTKLAVLKIKMIASATRDAMLRATTIAQNAACRLGKLRNANMGVFQITAQNSSEDFSWGGAYNTSSMMKTASITMRMQYEIK